MVRRGAFDSQPASQLRHDRLQSRIDRLQSAGAEERIEGGQIALDEAVELRLGCAGLSLEDRGDLSLLRVGRCIGAGRNRAGHIAELADRSHRPANAVLTLPGLTQVEEGHLKLRKLTAHGINLRFTLSSIPSDSYPGAMSMHTAIVRIVTRRLIISALPACIVLAAGPQVARAQHPPAKQAVYSSPSGLSLRLIFGDSGIGPEVSMGELTFPPNIDSGDHAHGATEVLYVLSGELEHTVDGVTTILKPGMAGFVRPPAKIRHKTGSAGAKVLVVWAPGDEAARIAARWKREP